MMPDEDVSRPPFAEVESLAPAEVAAEIVACFERLSDRPDGLQHGHALAMRCIAIDREHPLYRAGTSIARDIDQGRGAGVPDGYHNARHFLEVTLCTLYLARTARLDRARSARVLTAALVHDFHHDGSRASAAPFRLEAQAATRADPYLRRASVARDVREQIRALVLATEPATGVPFARACLEGRSVAAPADCRLAQPLARLRTEPDLAFEAVLLAEADVLPSIGLTLGHGQYVQDRLAAEWHTSLGPEDKLEFIERVRGHIVVARFFAPNIEAMRLAFQRRTGVPNGADGPSSH